MYSMLIKAFASAAGSKVGGKLFDLLSEQERRLQNIDRKVNEIYGEVLQLGLQQRLAPYSVRRQKLAADVANFDDLLNAPQPPSSATLDNIETRYIRTRHDSYYFAASDFVRELIGVELGQGILRDSFSANPAQFENGAIYKYATILTRKGELPLERYLEYLATFSLALLRDLEVLSLAYTKGHEVLLAFGRLAASQPRAEFLERWLHELGIARDLVPLLGECVSAVASPAIELGEISKNPARKRAASLVFRFRGWILENKPSPFFFSPADHHKPYTGYPSLYGSDKPHLTSTINYHWWEIGRALSHTAGAISLRAGSSDDKYLCRRPDHTLCTTSRPGDVDASLASWKVVVCSNIEEDPTLWFELRSVKTDDALGAADLSITDMVDIIAGVSPGAGNRERCALRVILWPDRLYTGGFLRVGEALTSLTARHQFRFDAARGLVVSEKDRAERVLWSPPAGLTIGPHWRVYVREDGLHIFSTSRALVDHEFAGASGPVSGAQLGKPEQRTQVLIMQDDGNLVFYDVKDTGVTALSLEDENHIPVHVHAPTVVELAA